MRLSSYSRDLHCFIDLGHENVYDRDISNEVYINVRLHRGTDFRTNIQILVLGMNVMPKKINVIGTQRYLCIDPPTVIFCLLQLGQ